MRAPKGALFVCQALPQMAQLVGGLPRGRHEKFERVSSEGPAQADAIDPVQVYRSSGARGLIGGLELE